MSFRRVRERAAQGDRGAVLLVVAFAMTLIMIVAAIVLDLGQLRSTRRSDQAAADLAALAAGAYLSGSASDPVAPDPRGACVAAFESIKANVDDFPAGATMNCNSLPATSTPPACTSTSANVLLASGAAPYQLEIRYPVPDSAISDPRFAGGGANDGTEPCERMQVTLTRTNEPFFAGVMGVESMQVSASSTVRAAVGQDGRGVAALLLLERVGCGAIDSQAPNGGIRIDPSDATRAGAIQVDSVGTTAISGACTTNTNSGGMVVWGRELSSNSDPSVNVVDAPDGSQGTIGLYSLMVGGRGAHPVPTGVYPAPTPGRPTSRAPVDEKYNLPTSAGGHAQITRLHADAYHYTVKLTSQSANTEPYLRWWFAQPQNDWAVYDTCTGSDNGGVFPASASGRVFVNCTETFKVHNVLTRFPGAREVVFNGNVEVTNNGTLAFPVAQRLYVRGCPTSRSGCENQNNSFALKIDGRLRVNTGGDGTASASCASRSGAPTTRIATFGGPLRVSGSISLCNSFVYLGQDQPTYQRRSQTSDTAPVFYPGTLRTMCSPDLPCPTSVGTGLGFLALTGGGSDIDWTAPNELNRQPELADFVNHPFEDLALWTESSATSEIKGQGNSVTSGVFFAPNAVINYSGQASLDQPRNAQFVARRLILSGQGTLVMRPDPADAVLIPMPDGWSLIR